MKLRALPAIAVLLIALPAAALAQSGAIEQDVIEAARQAASQQTAPATPAQRPSIPLSGPVDPKTYRVGPGDMLQLAVWGRVTRNENLEVSPEGTVLVPGAGIVRVDGKTLAEAHDLIIQRVRTQLRGVEMDVRLARPRRFNVYRTGQVKLPGPVEASAVSRVSDALTADDVLPDASRRQVNVIHLDGTRDVADLELFERTGRTTLNPWLRDGDIIHVPVATEFIYMTGAVARPGRYELGLHDSLLTALHLAGDPVPSASADSVLLVRWPEPFRADSIWLRLDDIYSGAQNPPLEDGERLYVFFVPRYHEQREATVIGEIARPGTYPIVEGRTHLSDLIKAAGGFLETADRGAIRVHRPSPALAGQDPEMDRLLRLSRNELTASEYEVLRTRLAGRKEDYSADWERIGKEGSSADLLLRNGDIVRIDRLVSSIRIDGEVRRPGLLEYQPGLKVDDYVHRADGFTKRAWTGKVRVTRAVTGQTLYAKDVGTVGPGDLVWVPEKPDRNWGQAGIVAVTVLASLSTIVLAIVTINNNNK